MTRPRSRRLLTLIAAAGALAVVVLAGVYWRDVGAWLEFYRLFESIGVNDQGYPEYRHRQTGIVMVRVPGGTFIVGTSGEEAKRVTVDVERTAAENPFLDRFVKPGLPAAMSQFLETEKPQHEVTLSPFLIAKYELTQAEWQSVMGEIEVPSRVKGDSLPMHSISWDHCKEFTKETGLSLPAEAQWEYACRAGTEGLFAGSGKLDDMGWYLDNSGAPAVPPWGTIHPVGQKQSNALGLHDMHGNVAEWCEDVYDGAFYSKPEALGPDPIAVSGSDRRVTRGGGYASIAEYCRSAFRSGTQRYSRGQGLGFRPAYYPLPPGL